MSSLSVCLKRIGAGKHEETILRAMAADYQRDGYEAHAAAVNAVKDYIRELEEERADIIRQVKEAGGEVGGEEGSGKALKKEPWQMLKREYADTPGATNVPQNSILALHPDKITSAKLKEFKGRELEQLLIVLGAPHSGTKKEKRNRILRTLDIRNKLKGATVESLIESETIESLKDIARVLGETVSIPNKYGMASSLINWRNNARMRGQSAISDARHYLIVQKAVSEGKPVPAEVLAEYPGLQEKTLENVSKETIIETEAQPAQEVANESVEPEGVGAVRPGGPADRGTAERSDVRGSAGVATGQPAAAGGEALPGEPGEAEGGALAEPATGEPGTAAADTEGRAPRPGGRKGVRPDRGAGGRPGSILESPEAAAGKRPGKDSKQPAELAPEDRNHVIEPGDEIVPAGDEGKIKANIKAIQLVKRLVAENRNPSPEEKKVLAQFTGWGAFAQKVFKDDYTRHLDAFAEGRMTPERAYWYQNELEKFRNWERKYGKKLHPKLGGALTQEEWDAAKASTLNAHYTDRDVISRMWGLVGRLGFKGGNVLEPAAGVGHFIGLMPQELAAQSRVNAVELDSITGQILTKLYPQARVQVMGFEKSRGIPDNSQDLVISNFPFGKFSVFDPKRPQYGKWSIHNYFFGRSIDAVRPGGLVVAITSHFTMDAVTNGEIRAALAKKADFVGGIRLPYTAFKKNAGTEVVTDILVFRKKDATSYGLSKDFRVAEQVEVAAGKPPAFINEYFVKNPEMVMGKNAMTGSMRGADEYTVEPTSTDLDAQIAKALEAFPENILGEGNAAEAVADAETKYATMKDIDGSLVERDGEIYMVSEGKLVAPTIINDKGQEAPALSSASRKARAQQYLKIKAAHQQLIDRSNTREATEDEIAGLRVELNRVYDDFVKKFGNVGDPGNSFLKRIDLEFPIVDALENEEVSIVADTVKSGPNKGQPVNRRVKTFTKADVFTKRTTYPFIEPETAANIEEAATLSEVYRAGLDTGYIAKLLSRDEEEVKAELVDKGMAFINPATGLLEPPDIYLSGNVKTKLREAQAAAEDNPAYAGNVKALEAVQPAPVDIEFIHFRLGTPWIPGEAISDFLKETMGVEATAEYSKNSESSRWNLAVAGGDRTALNRETWGAGGRTGDDLVADSLNMKRTVVTYSYTDGNGNRKTARDDEKTEAAQAKQEEIQEEFLRWARGSEKWKKALADVYNEEKNGRVLRSTETPKIEHFPGANPLIKLRALQKRFVARGLRESTIFAYGVGTGKTYSFISLAMEMRRVGTAKKPMIVVQNATIGQYRKAFNQLYPGARVLIPDEKQRAARYRQRLLSQIATGDWDAVVVPHSFFDAIADDVDREIGFIREQITMIEEAIADALAEEGKNSFTVKDLEALKKRKTDRIEKALNRRKDKALTFERMGIDALLVDEAHAYKRSEFFTKMQRVKGIDQGASQRSTSLLMKARFVQEKTGGKNVILATGTPISNTTAELWTIIRYVRPDLLEDYGVELFDGFAATFGDTQTALEETETGTYREVERFNKYVNGPELLTMWRTAADVQLTRDAGLRLPDIAGGKPEFVTVERTPSLNRFIDQIRAAREQWDNMKGKEKMQNRHVPLVLFGLAKKAAVDMRLVSSAYEDHPDSKINKVVEKVHEIWKGTSGNRSTQIVFLDSQNDSTKTFNSHEDMRAKLIEKGIPKEEVALVTDAKSDSAREALFDRVRSGAVRVIIGSSQKLGVGVNIQDLLIAAHHVDVPPRPMDIEQRNGRIVREGNLNPKVRIYNYGVRATLDSVMYDRLTKKQRFIDQMLVGEIEGREFDDPLSEEQASLAEMMAAFSGNPLVFEKTDVELKVKKLRRAKLRWEHEVSMARRKADTTQNDIESAKQRLAEAKKTAADLERDVPGGKLTKFELNGKPVDRKEINEALAAFVEAENAKHPKQFIKAKEFDDYLFDVKPAHFQFKANGQRVQVGVRPSYSRNYNVEKSKENKEGKEWNLDAIPDIAVGFGRKGDDFLIKRSIERSGGLLASLENSIDRVFAEPGHIQKGIESDQKDLAEYEKISRSQFKQADELAEAVQHLAEIERQLHALPSQVNRSVANEGNAIGNLLNFARIEREGEEENEAEGGSLKAEVGEEQEAEEAAPKKAEFFIFTNKGYKPVPNGRRVEIVPWAETFTHNVPGEEFTWTVSEVTTGLAIESRAGTRKQVIEAAREKLERAGEAEFKKMVATAEKVPEDLRGGEQDLELAKPSGKIAGADIPLADVRKVFPGQKIEQDKNGIWITTRAGRQLLVRSVDHIDVDKATVDAYFGREIPADQTYTTVGASLRGRGVIQLVREKGTNAWVLRHESVHWMEDAGILRKDDVRALKMKIEQEVKAGRWTAKNEKDIGGKEDRANWIRQELANREKHRGALRRILDTVADLLDTLVNLFKVTARGVVREIESGRIYERGGGEFLGIEKGSGFRVQGPGKQDYDIVDDMLPPGPAERYREAQGAAKPKLLDVIREKAQAAVATFTPGRLFPKMPNRYFGRENVLLREFMEAGDYGRARAIMELKDILDPKNLKAEDYKLFGLKLVLDDMQKDMEPGGVLEAWEEIAAAEGEVAFGFKSKDEVDAALAKVDAELSRRPEVAKAIRRRQRAVAELRKLLVENKMLPKQVLDDERYFHHQVLEYANAKRGKGMGQKEGETRVRKAGWQYARTGSIKDYNTKYLESEFEVLAQGYERLARKQVLDEIGQHADIMGELKSRAKRDNLNNFYEAKAAQLRQLMPEITATDMRQPQNDPLLPYRQKIAMGLGQLSKLAERGELDAGPFEDVVEALAERDADEAVGFDPDGNLFRYLAWLADASDKEGSAQARMIFKAIGDRNREIKTTLGRKFKTWRDVMKERPPRAGSTGWAEWVPRPGTAWYMTNSINDQILGEVLAGNRQLTEADVRPVLARGADVRWVIPAELAEVMDGADFQRAPKDNVVSQAAESTMNMWKRWILINPLRVIKYNLNNTSGDLDIVLAYDPRILRHAGAAIRDLWKYHYDKEMSPALREEFKTAFKYGVVGGITAHDIPDIGKMADFRQLERAMGAKDNVAIDLIKRFWHGSKNFTQYRENVLRLAAFRYFKERVAAGERVYGASLPNKVNAIGNDETDRKAGLLARELIGDYGGLSKGGRWLRRKLIPFYSWMEINAPRYWRLMRNVAIEKEPAGRRAALLGAVAGKKAAFLGAKVFMMYGAVALWNALVFPDEEEELGEEGRRQMHLILGRRADGSIVTLRLQGALSDALSWFNLHDFPEDMKELAAGKKTVYQWAGEAAREPVNKMIQGVRPDIKGFGELVGGKTVYPDFTRPRPIRDKGEYVARMLSLEGFYRKAVGRPMKGGDVGGQVWDDVLRTFSYSASPGETAYYGAREMVSKFLEDRNIERPFHEPTDRSNALYWYKTAIKYGDAEAAERYLQKYKDLGGSMKGLKISVDRAHPLASMPKKYRTKFLNQLSDEDRETVKRAGKWYKETFKR